MKTVEFIKKHGYYYDYEEKRHKIITPYAYQINLLNELETNQFVAVNSARQMGVTQMLSFHLANWLINNKTDMNICYLMSHSLRTSMEFNPLDQLISLAGQLQREQQFKDRLEMFIDTELKESLKLKLSSC